MEGDATPHCVKITPHTPDHILSFRIPAEVTQFGDHLDLDADDELVDSSAAGGNNSDLAMTIGASQVDVFGSFYFEAIWRTISRRFVDDVGEELQTLLVD